MGTTIPDCRLKTGCGSAMARVVWCASGACPWRVRPCSTWSALVPGAYLMEVRSGSEVATHRLVKLAD